MQICTELRSLFDSTDRRRGHDYFQRGEVGELELYDGFIYASVHGSNGIYEVQINLGDLDDEDAFYCSCPRFAGGFLCKHLWAVILEFDKGNLYSGLSLPSTSELGTSKKVKRNSKPSWQAILSRVASDDVNSTLGIGSPARKGSRETCKSEVIYLIDTGNTSVNGNQIKLSVLQRIRRKNGEWGKQTALRLSHSSVQEIGQDIDQCIARQLLGANRQYSFNLYQAAPASFFEFDLDPHWAPELCSLLVDSKRFFWTLDKSLPMDDFRPIHSFDLETPARIAMGVVEEQNGPVGKDLFHVAISREGEQIDNSDVVKVSENGVMLLSDRICSLSNPKSLDLWKLTKNGPPIEIAKSERAVFLAELARKNLISRIGIPGSWQLEKVEDVSPTAVLQLSTNPYYSRELCGNVLFMYGDTEVELTSTKTAFFDESSNCWFERNKLAESQRLNELFELPIVNTTQDHWCDFDFTMQRLNLGMIVDDLADRGWIVKLHGEPVRHANSFDVAVESGQDWFDLSVNVDFKNDSIALPRLLQAIVRKEDFIVLADGSHGRVSKEMVRKYARLAEFGEVEGDNVRFRPSQAMLLDAMLDATETKMDAGFRNFRKKLNSFDGIKPKNPPRGFQGKLRDYQTEGLGWLHFLNHFQMGGCLADDMGLGKTVQVLSLLEHRRTRRTTKPGATVNLESGNHKNGRSQRKPKKQDLPLLVKATSELKRKPSIVVVPKSLIFNWIEEAAKFTPRLRILNYTGTQRRQAVEQVLETGGFDVLITTYGTMRNDISELSQIEFDYAILDESQAIKNSKAQCAKASRLLNAEHRLAMTGTPVENHIGELWSLFEFLNPGMLGNSTGFSRLTSQKKSQEAEREETLDALSRALKPYLLRRTKEQVLTELPPKTEQTLYCEMLPAQKKAYNELKKYYRVKLAKKVETEGIGRSKIQVLEALLRLRQVACDPRLVDDSAKAGAKLELLQQQLSEIISDGHKVLIFSQFTSYLALVKQQFDQQAIAYEYLDGKSRKRADSVKRFQEDPMVQAFLISIKAGGHGLNLTAADYVFLLDPWWNPAVEAQAIDRAHRIGQNNPVIAYRMVCRDTVEEKILELQKAKKNLAEKVIRSDESLIRSLTATDLQLILS